MTFTASNGLTVELGAGVPPRVVGQGWSSQLLEAEEVALREFFRHERDEELGRWRDIEGEAWRVIPGYEGYYEVSSEGRVRSVPRTLPDGRQRKGKLLKQSTTKGNGRLKVTLAKDGRSTNVKVHQLVAQAFLGAAPDGKTLVLHSDGNHLNNRAANLRWGNYSDNVRDSIKHGTWRNQHTVEAHPVPKPWHDAKVNEAWELTVNGDTGPFVTRLTPSGAVHFVAGNGSEFVAESSYITAGRRIYTPEVTF